VVMVVVVVMGDGWCVDGNVVQETNFSDYYCM
jgi:hypothetical protein